MEQIIGQLKKNKTGLSLSSIKTYGYIIRNVLKKMGLKETEFEQLLKQQDKVLVVLKDQTPQSRKTNLAVLVSLFGADKTQILRDQMLKDSIAYNDILKQQTRTEKQEKNWMEWKDITNRYNELVKQYSPLLKKQNLNKKEFQHLVDLILLAVYVLIPPRRSLDYVLMKIRNYDPKTDNYFDGSSFYFNKYKTNDTYGTQKIKLPLKLRALIKKWMLVNPTDFLLFDTKNNPLSQSRLTIKLNNIFDKNISSSLLRHIYVSEQLKDAPRLKEKEELALAMGHSAKTQDTYAVYEK